MKNKEQPAQTNQTKERKINYAQSFKEQLTIRGLILSAFGSVIITTSSVYVALRMGVLPFPTLFVAIFSMAVLKILGKTNVNEINVAHTGMSAGGCVAAGVAFSIPGIWMMDKTANPSIVSIMILVLCAAYLGIIFSAVVRKHYIEDEELPYPTGIAAYETVIAGDEGGSKAKLLFGTICLAAIFTTIRDWFGKIPLSVAIKSLESKFIFVGIWISPMLLGTGFLIGPVAGTMFMIGAALCYFMFIPLSMSFELFDSLIDLINFKNSLAIGMLIGAGVGIFLKSILPKFKTIYGPLFASKSSRKSDIDLKFAPFVMAIAALFITWFTEIHLLASLFIILGIWLTTAMIAYIVGTSGIAIPDVMGIIVLLITKAVLGTTGVEGILVICAVAVATSLSADVMNDFKAGYLLKTNPKAQFASEIVGATVGAIVSVVVVFMMQKAFGEMGPGTDLIAPQAYAMTLMVGGLPYVSAFFIGLVLAILLHFLKVPFVVTLGLGFYLPMQIASVIFLGGLIRYFIGKNKDFVEKGILVSSGLLGGEGVAGVVIALINLAMKA